MVDEFRNGALYHQYRAYDAEGLARQDLQKEIESLKAQGKEDLAGTLGEMLVKMEAAKAEAANASKAQDSAAFLQADEDAGVAHGAGPRMHRAG